MRNVAQILTVSHIQVHPNQFSFLQVSIYFQKNGRRWACSRAIVPCGCCDLWGLAQHLHDPAVSKQRSLHMQLMQLTFTPNHTWHGCGLKWANIADLSGDVPPPFAHPKTPPGSRLKAAVPEVMVTKNGSSTCTTLWRLRMIGTISLLPFGNISNKNLKAINIPSTSTLIYPLASFMFFCESEVLMDRMMGNPKFAAWFQTKENERRKLSEVEICKIQLCKPTAGPLKQ